MHLTCVRPARVCARSLNDYRDELVKGVQGMLQVDISEGPPPFASPIMPQQPRARAAEETDADADRPARDRRPPAPQEVAAETAPAPKSRSGARKARAEGGEAPNKVGRPRGESAESKLAKAEAKLAKAEARADVAEARARTAEKLLEEQKVDLAVAKAKLQASYFITQAAGLGGRGQPGCSSDTDATPDMRTGALPTPSALAKFFEM